LLPGLEQRYSKALAWISRPRAQPSLGTGTSAVYAAQDRVAGETVGHAVQRGEDRHLRRVGHRAAASRRKRGEPLLELLGDLAAEPEVDRASAPDGSVRQAAGDEHRLGAAVGRAADPGDREPVRTPKLVLDPEGAPSPGKVRGFEALGDDALEAKLDDACDELLGAVDDDARQLPSEMGCSGKPPAESDPSRASD
jgi:hypothetical protein